MFAIRCFTITTISLLINLGSFAQIPAKERVIAGSERAFEKAAKTHNGPAPGCAVGVSLSGETVFEKAFGLAEMEHNIPNTPQTIFESGSVAKQFTAAALVLLQQDGKLSLNDPVRKHIPEMPDYGAPMTIRHLLNHTAGLRDWGSVMALTGVGRGDRVINHDVAFDVIIRQKGLDFTPGAEYSYSNSGYQLAAIIVERVSKQKFGDFVTERLFKPLGMKNSTWRDDYQRLVPRRAQGYSRQGANAPWRLNMPFMNVYGNGGMLTTVGDWLKWNAMLDSRSLGAALVENLETQAVLNDGRRISYALGLDVGSYHGIKEVSHSGGTAGYQTFLVRFPEKKLSVGALCNGAPPFAGDIVYGIVDEIFGPFPEPAIPEAAKVTEEQLKKFVGNWRNNITRNVNPIALEKGVLKLGAMQLVPMADGSFLLGQRKIKFVAGSNGEPVNAEISNLDGSVTRLTKVTPWSPTPADLGTFAGDWYSDEAQATFKFDVEGDRVYYVQRPSTRLALRPLYRDHFAGPNFGILILSCWLAAKNIRSGRSDLKGTIRLVTVLFAMRMLSWLFSSHFVASLGQLTMLIAGIQSALYWGVSAGLMYLAFEPFLRRRAPERIISWSRLLAGDWRDPLIGRDILIGGAAASVVSILWAVLKYYIPLWQGLPPSLNTTQITGPGDRLLAGIGGVPMIMIDQLSSGVIGTFIVSFLILFVGMLLRRSWLGVAAVILIVAAVLLSEGGSLQDPYKTGGVFIVLVSFVLIAARYGVLAMLSMSIFSELASRPVTSELTAWYAGEFVMYALLLGALAVFGFYTSTAGQKLWQGKLLPEYD